MSSINAVRRKWRASHSVRQRSQETIGSDPLIGFFQFCEKLSRKIRLPVAFPETIVYEHHFPRGWYWFEKSSEGNSKSGKNDQKKKRNKEPQHGKMSNLLSLLSQPLDTTDDMLTVESETLRIIRSKGCETSSLLDSLQRNSKTDILAEVARRLPNNSIDVTYLDAQGLRSWLVNIPEQCILSRFILPKGNRNEIISACWTPGKTLVSRLQNINNIYDKDVPLRDRSTTNDPSTCAEVNCSKAVKQLVDRVMQCFVREFQLFEKKKVINFEAEFKIDADAKLWILRVTTVTLIPCSAVHPLLSDSSCLNKLTPGDPSTCNYLKLSELTNNCVDNRRRRICQDRFSNLDEAAPLDLQTSSKPIKTHFSIPITTTGIKRNRKPPQKGGWPSFCPPEVVDLKEAIQSKLNLLKPNAFVKKKKRNEKEQIKSLQRIVTQIDYTQVDSNINTENLESVMEVPPNSSEDEDAVVGVKSNNQIHVSSVYVPVGARKRGYSQFYDMEKKSFKQYQTDRQLLSSSNHSMKVSDIFIKSQRERDHLDSIHVPDDEMKRLPTVPSGVDEDLKDAEKKLLIKSLSSSRMAQYSAFLEECSQLREDLIDLEYTVYSKLQSDLTLTSCVFSLPIGCPNLGYLEDLHLEQEGSSSREGSYIIRFHEGQPKHLVLRQTMIALRRKVEGSLRKSELSILLKDLDGRTIKELEHHRLPNRRKSVSRLSGRLSGLSSTSLRRSGIEKVIPGLVTLRSSICGSADWNELSCPVSSQNVTPRSDVFLSPTTTVQTLSVTADSDDDDSSSSTTDIHTDAPIVVTLAIPQAF